MKYPNNTIFDISNIGEDDSALFCLTNSPICCTSREAGVNASLGNWYLPNGDPVVYRSERTIRIIGITVTRGPNAILLHRSNNVIEPMGKFICELPDFNGFLRYLHAGIII